MRFNWFGPQLIGILGNEIVDKLAKKENIEVNIKMSKSEGKNIVWKEAVREWQRKWDREAKGRHFKIKLIHWVTGEGLGEKK